MFGNDFREEEAKDYSFKDDVGLIGRAFTKNDKDNLADAPSSSFFVTRSSRKPNYHGLLLVPVRILDQAVGMISIDRQAKPKFSDNAVRFAWGLAAQIAFAFAHPRTRHHYDAYTREFKRSFAFLAR
jgi:signal transduction protein with GAF and PtsI domain